MALGQKRDLLGIAVTQFFILNIAWAFYIVVKIKHTIPLPDSTAIWVYHNPTETTVVVTIIATAVSSITLSCFTRAAKHALKQYIGSRKSISLAGLGIGVAATSASCALKRGPRYLGPTLGTLIIATVFGLVNSAWTTFLSPVQVNVVVSMSGEELDLGNQEFDTVLGRDMNNTFGFSNGTLVTQPNSANALTSFASNGGLTSATAYASGQRIIVNFNNVTYSISTGGILSAVTGYGGTQNTTSTSASGTPASFGGGPVPTTLKASSGLTGLSSAYNITQQGLTANVSCYNYTNPADWYPIEVQAISVNATFEMDGYVSGIVPVVNTTVPRMSCNQNISGNGMIASVAAVNFNNSNYLASTVCPYTWQDALNAQMIVVYHAGVGKYASLPPTVCEIVPLLTRSSVIYANQLITSTPQNTTAIPYQHNLNYWVALFVELEEWGFQTARVNSLGNMLMSLLTVGPASFSEAPVQSYQMFLEYWKGVVEVTGTALRSGYTAYPQNVTSMRTPISGTQSISTMGWSFDNGARAYALIPITIAAVMTFGAISFALYHVYRFERLEERQDARLEESIPYDGQLGCLVVPHTAIRTFDASDPVHLIVASAAQRPSPEPQVTRGERYWEQHGEERVLFRLERQVTSTGTPSQVESSSSSGLEMC